MIHIANILFLFSYCTKDIIKLRYFITGALVSLLFYYINLGLIDAIIWTVLFIIINLGQLIYARNRRNKIK